MSLGERTEGTRRCEGVCVGNVFGTHLGVCVCGPQVSVGLFARGCVLCVDSPHT